MFLLMGLVGPLAAESETPLTAKEARARFEKADKALNAVWSKVKKSLPASSFDSLKAEQKAWVESRDYLALSPGYSGAPVDEKLAPTSPEYFETAAILTETRTQWLTGLLVEPNDEPLTGKWSDSYGGEIELVEKDGQLLFLLGVVRGPTAHSGHLAGRASWNAPLGWFTDKGRDPDKDTESNIAFVLRDQRLELIGAGTDWYHGARAYFDGMYVRIAPLSPEDVTRVTKAGETGDVPELAEP